MNDRLWFRQAADSLFVQSLEGQLSPSLKTRLTKLGMNVDRLEPAYPAQVFAAAVRATAAEVFPLLDADEATYRLGEIFSEGAGKSIWGKALFSLLKLLGPRRTLPRMRTNFQSITNYLDPTVIEALPDRFQIHFAEVDDIPHFIKGMIDSTGLMLNAPRISSPDFRYDGHALTLFIDLRTGPSDLPFP